MPHLGLPTCAAVPLCCRPAGAGFVDFLIDSSSYLSHITPAMRDRLGFSPTDGVAIVTGNSSSSSSGGNGGISSSSGGISSSSAGISGSSSGSSSSGAGGSSSSRTRVKLRQRVTMPKMWLGEPGFPLFGQIKG